MPYVNSPGEKYRIRQLLYQLPPHDNEVCSVRLHSVRIFAARLQLITLSYLKKFKSEVCTSKNIFIK